MNYKITICLIALMMLMACNSGTDNPKTVSDPLIELSFDDNKTVTYYEAINDYQKLADHYPEASLLNYGVTDAGKPLHLFVMSKDGDFDPESIKKSGRSIVLVNNGIHPGEPEGIDASIWFADDVLRNADDMYDLLDNCVVCIIPVYNVGGCLNRSAFHRTGQTSPQEGGYRGNAKNLDLNRDFTKMDTKNAEAFAEIFRSWDPDLFLDTHTTNGSDHKYVITLIEYQPEAFPEPLQDFYRNNLIPSLYEQMKETPYEMIPYVSFLNESPKSGIALETQPARFSSGYAGLFNTMGFITENHIYKPFPDRVRSVYYFLKALTGFANDNATRITDLRKQANEYVSSQQQFVLEWKLDTTQFSMIRFQGYEGEIGVSPVTGLKRFGYNREKPYDTIVRYYSHHIPSKIISAPEYYILPSAWDEVVERLQLNKVKMFRLAKDTAIEAEQYFIKDVKTGERAYNWHHYHSDFELESNDVLVNCMEGDWVIPVDQPANKYIVEMLEPEGQDSFFRWNFFDPCLERREYYSSYGFEENALKYLDEHPDFKKQFEEAVKNDPELAKNHRAQLGYIYENTEWADNRVGRYPVLRIDKKMDFPLK